MPRPKKGYKPILELCEDVLNSGSFYCECNHEISGMITNYLRNSGFDVYSDLIKGKGYQVNFVRDYNISPGKKYQRVVEKFEDAILTGTLRVNTLILEDNSLDIKSVRNALGNLGYTPCINPAGQNSHEIHFYKSFIDLGGNK